MLLRETVMDLLDHLHRGLAPPLKIFNLCDEHSVKWAFLVAEGGGGTFWTRAIYCFHSSGERHHFNHSQEGTILAAESHSLCGAWC